MALERGILVVSKKGYPLIELNGKTFNVAQGELSQSIMGRLKQLNGTEVEFERENGLPKKIREAGGVFVEPNESGATTRHSSRQTESRRGFQTRNQSLQNDNSSVIKKSDFHNPYNFIPAPPRNINDSDLGDHEPVAQDRFYQDRITGRIRVFMEAITPLLILDPNSSREDVNGHKTFALLKDKDGRPFVPSSSIRGMIRATYEAVTNSRFGRFPKKDNDKRLAYRMDAREGLHLIPARIQDGKIHLLTGTSVVGQSGAPEGPQYAAWLPRYNGPNKSTHQAKKYSDKQLPQHGDKVDCLVELITHRSNRFKYWKVIEIEKVGGIDKRLRDQLTGEGRLIRGWVCITNANIDRKHDERVFFSSPSPLHSSLSLSFPIDETHRQKWRELIQNYQEIHADELNKRKKKKEEFDQYLGSNQAAWSRHIYKKEERELKEGTLCYVRLTKDKKNVDAIFPVMISRELYSSSPWDLLHPSLKPALKLSELSPADRVFGWVLADSKHGQAVPKGQTAVRGLLRVSPVICKSTKDEAIELFNENGLPLNILAAPKPQQGRFYVAKSKNGDAQSNGLLKYDAGYFPTKGLRGRKVYPHHSCISQGHWDNPLQDRTKELQGPWQEYRRPKLDDLEQRDDQNRSILEWVKPGCRFEFDIRVTNLSKVELGALLFLIDLPKNHFHRFGGGKPFGFGSVRLGIIDSELSTGDALKKRYSSWTAKPEIDNKILEDALSSFKKAVCRTYTQNNEDKFEQISYIMAFLRSCKGFDDNLPTHYPRATANGLPCPPNPKGESFKWFVANEKNTHQYSLGDLSDDTGLPTL